MKLRKGAGNYENCVESSFKRNMTYKYLLVFLGMVCYWPVPKLLNIALSIFS